MSYELCTVAPSADDGLVSDDICCFEDVDNVNEESARTSDISHSFREGHATGIGAYNAQDVNDALFEELHLPDPVAEEVSLSWAAFMQVEESREMAAEAVYAAIFDAATDLQGLFKTPRAFLSLRILAALSQVVGGLSDPKGLKTHVETLAFQHMDIDVTIPRVTMFRDAIVELLQEELGSRFSDRAQHGWCTALNYVGGAFIYVRETYADRLKLLAQSWALASSTSQAEATKGITESDCDQHELGASPKLNAISERVFAKAKMPRDPRGKKSSSAGASASSPCGLASDHSAELFDNFGNTGVPRSFRDMFMFNATVMGCASSGWMQEVLLSFDTLVNNISNFHRLREECDILSLRIARYKTQIGLGEFKIVMLSSLRSLVREWGSAHETAWSWFWENVERMLKTLIGKPVAQEAALARFMKRLDSDTLQMARQDIYRLFFALAPAGQNHFKQSTTRLHFIADKVFAFSLDIYRQPKRMIDDLSALGLRHVGYGIPTELFGPFVTCFVQVVSTLDKDRKVVEAFSWALDLISRVLQRVIIEGSTAVMHAINANSGKQLARAAAFAPRGKRALWMLSVQVGTQSISPLMWAIESGSFDATRAILEDLLAIRADRDSYYYGMEQLFKRHPDIIKRLSVDAPSMLPILLDGLVWRSRSSVNGKRRVNYYIKHIVVDSKGDFNQATKWLVDFNDPKLACHPIVSFVTDTTWTRVALRTFLYRRAWFLLTVIMFMLAESVLHHIDYVVEEDASRDEGSAVSSHRRMSISDSNETRSGDSNEAVLFQHKFEVRVGLIVTRAFVYVFSLGSLLVHHSRRMCRSITARAFTAIGWATVPSYLMSWQEMASFCLTLCLASLLCFEPLLRCAKASADLFDEHCPAADPVHNYYKPLSVITILLYFFMLGDLAVLSTRVSAFVLVCGTVVSEVLLFLAACTFVVLAFASVMCAVQHSDADFDGIPISALNLYRINFRMFSADKFDHLNNFPILFVCAFFFTAITVMFLLNLLIAQLNCAYQATYKDMRGLAQLSRAKTLVDSMPMVPRSKWVNFVASLRLEEPIDFGEGDIGFAGGVQVLEPASKHVTTIDRIRRYGGTTSPDAPWPNDTTIRDGDGQRLERLEKYIEKAMKRLSGRGRGRRSGSSVGRQHPSMTSRRSSGDQGSSFGQDTNFSD